MRVRRGTPGLVAGLLLACACAGGDDTAEDAGDSRDPACTGGAELAASADGTDGAEGTGAEATDEGPIVLWHSVHPIYADVLDEALAQAEQASGVPVEAVEIEGGTGAVVARWREASRDEAPDLVLLTEDWARVALDGGLTAPVDDCVRRAGVDLLPAVEASYTIDGELRAVPFLASAPVLIYDRNDLAAAGVAPDEPPRTLEGLRATCERVIDAEAAASCLALDVGTDSGGSWYVHQWQAQLGQAVVEPGNGREGEPATNVRWDAPGIADRLAFLQDLVADGLAVQVGPNEDNQDDLALLVDAEAPVTMTLHTSASLGPLLEASADGAFPGVDLAVAPFPGPAPGEGTLVGGSALWVVADEDGGEASPRTVSAARLAAELATAGPQATMAAGTGYAPVTPAALDDPDLQDAWRRLPGLRVAYDQLRSVEPTPAALGPLVGPAHELREALAAATTAILAGADPVNELAEAAAQADALLAAYADTQG